MGSSVRVIKIVKDPYTKEESYTVEFECVVEDSKELVNELTKSILGKRAIELLNQSEFLPEEKTKTEEEIRAEAEEEEKARLKHEEELREEGREEIREKYIRYIKKKRKPNESDESATEKDVKEESDKNDFPIQRFGRSHMGIYGYGDNVV